jgi:hypothetical protein
MSSPGHRQKLKFLASLLTSNDHVSTGRLDTPPNTSRYVIAAVLEPLSRLDSTS